MNGTNYLLDISNSRSLPVTFIFSGLTHTSPMTLRVSKAIREALVTNFGPEVRNMGAEQIKIFTVIFFPWNCDIGTDFFGLKNKFYFRLHLVSQHFVCSAGLHDIQSLFSLLKILILYFWLLLLAFRKLTR